MRRRGQNLSACGATLQTAISGKRPAPVCGRHMHANCTRTALSIRLVQAQQEVCVGCAGVILFFFFSTRNVASVALQRSLLSLFSPPRVPPPPRSLESPWNKSMHPCIRPPSSSHASRPIRSTRACMHACIGPSFLDDDAHACLYVCACASRPVNLVPERKRRQNAAPAEKKKPPRKEGCSQSHAPTFSGVILNEPCVTGRQAGRRPGGARPAARS